MKVENVKVDTWQQLGRYLYHNEEVLFKAVTKLRKQARNRLWLGIIFGSWLGYRIGKLEDQVTEIYRQTKKLEEKVNDLDDLWIVEHT